MDNQCCRHQKKRNSTHKLRSTTMSPIIRPEIGAVVCSFVHMIEPDDLQDLLMKDSSLAMGLARQCEFYRNGDALLTTTVEKWTSTTLTSECCNAKQFSSENPIAPVVYEFQGEMGNGVLDVLHTSSSLTPHQHRSRKRLQCTRRILC